MTTHTCRSHASAFQIAITPVAGYALLELLVRKELDQLGEDGAPSVHPALSLAPQQIPSNTLLTPFLFQIVLTPTRMHHTESKKRARSLWEFPRTAVYWTPDWNLRSISRFVLSFRVGPSEAPDVLYWPACNDCRFVCTSTFPASGSLQG